jgi:hypothetical protein
VHGDRLLVRLRPRRRGSDNLAASKHIRAGYPSRTRIYSVQDNLSAKLAIRAYAGKHNKSRLRL